MFYLHVIKYSVIKQTSTNIKLLVPTIIHASLLEVQYLNSVNWRSLP